MNERLGKSEDEPEPRSPTDTELVNDAVEFARVTEESIPHEVARVIAAHLAVNETSGLFKLAASGAIYLREITNELGPLLFEEGTPTEVIAWVEAMKIYIRERDDFGPQDGWSDLWVSPGYNEMDSCTVCSSHLSEPHYQSCPRGDVEAVEQEPGAGGDLMRLINRNASNIFDMGERVRVRNTVLEYIKANYLRHEETARIASTVRTEELHGVVTALKGSLQEAETDESKNVLVDLAHYLAGRRDAIENIAKRKPD